MDRRTALKAIGVGAFAVAPALGSDDKNVEDYGARPSSEPQIVRANRVPRFYDRFKPFKGISTLGRNVFLYKNLQKELGDFDAYYQGPAEDGSPGEGDCVGQSSAMGVNVLAATDIHELKQREKWVAECSVEMNYAGGRVEIGNLGGGTLRGRGGSHGEWQARYLKEFGVLHRKEYRVDDNHIDLRGYHPGRSRKYRDAGVPDWLEAIAKDHPVKEITQVRSGREALDAVSARQVVIMCSSYAVHDKRDADGFAEPYLDGQTRRGWRTFSSRYQWWHAQLLTAAILEGKRIGGTIQNSHGNDWISGPRPNDMPHGSYNVELPVLDLMVTDWFDCWALGSYHGHESKKRRHQLFR